MLSELEIRKKRKEIINKTKELKEGERLHVDACLLDELLFERVYFDPENTIIVKVPVWSGDFLSKIDLSEIDFEDVTWSSVTPFRVECDLLQRSDNPDTERMVCYEDRFMSLDENFVSNFSNTNAHIDFLKSAEKKILGKIWVEHVNFSGTDLSNNDLSEISYMWRVDLSYTGARFSKDVDDTKYKNTLKSYDMNYSGLDLSNITVSAFKMIDENYSSNLDTTIESGCIIKNTGINIVCDETEFYGHSDYTKIFSSLIKKGAYDGCNISIVRRESPIEKALMERKRRLHKDEK